MSDTPDSPDWAMRLSQSIAQEVRRNRERLGLSAQQLSDRCREIGLPIHRSVISNFENGRRGNLTIAELLVVAEALEIAPIFLLFPVGFTETIEVLPNDTVTAVDAVKWFAGDRGRGAYYPKEHPEYAIPYRLVLDEESLIKAFMSGIGNEFHVPEVAQSYIDKARPAAEESVFANAEVRRLKRKLQQMETEAASSGETDQVLRDLAAAKRRQREVDDTFTEIDDMAREAELWIAKDLETRVTEISAIRREMARRGQVMKPLPPEMAPYFEEEVR